MQGRLADDTVTEPRFGEGTGHRVQRPVPIGQHGVLAAEGVFIGELAGREIVIIGIGKLVDGSKVPSGNGSGPRRSAGCRSAPSPSRRLASSSILVLASTPVTTASHPTMKVTVFGWRAR